MWNHGLLICTVFACMLVAGCGKEQSKDPPSTTESSSSGGTLKIVDSSAIQESHNAATESSGSD